ncbi:unnamed protein product [Parajaminaea phylloscopi]
MLAFYGVDGKFASDLEQTLSDFIRSPRHSVILASASRSQRKFSHELAEAFGLVSESLDAEPKRSVQIRRTGEARVPRILPSEMYARAKKEHEAGLASVKTGPRLTSLRANGSASAAPAALNALIIEGLFGVDEATLRELLTESAASSLPGAPVAAASTAPLRLVAFTLKWAGDETVLVLPGDPSTTTIQRLVASKHEVLRVLKMNRLAKSVIACSVDPATMASGGMPRILRREDRPSAGTSVSPAASGRGTPVAWSSGADAPWASAAPSARLSGWAAVAGGSAAGGSSPMTPTYSAGSNSGVGGASSAAARRPVQLTGARGEGRREETPEAWDQ